MLSSVKIWNEPNNVSHWDADLDPGWLLFSGMLRESAAAIRRRCDTPIVLGGLSPIDVRFLRLLQERGALEDIDVLALHGFPLDWNLWPLESWPRHLETVRAAFDRPVWVTETGVSSFVSERMAAWGTRRMAELLRGERVYWYSLLDLDPSVAATTRHNKREGSGYFRHFHFGLLRHDGTPKAALSGFDASMGICQWFQYEDERTLELAVRWLKILGVRHVRTGLSWAESHLPGGWRWFDTIMSALKPFEVCVTLCFTPPSLGMRAHHTSPPRDLAAFADFAERVIARYAPSPKVRVPAEV